MSGCNRQEGCIDDIKFIYRAPNLAILKATAALLLLKCDQLYRKARLDVDKQLEALEGSIVTRLKGDL